MPLFKIFFAMLVLALEIWGDKITRLFDVYAAITILLFALFQNMAVTQEFGFAVIAGNVAVYLFVSSVWFLESVIKVNVLTFGDTLSGAIGLSRWQYLPIGSRSIRRLWGRILPAHLLTNSAGLTLCMMWPAYLAILTLCYPTINRPVLRITGFAGVITAGFNVLQWFFFTSYTWLGIVHFPLLTISLYS